MTTVFLTHLSANKHMNKYHSQIVVTIHSQTTTNRNESDCQAADSYMAKM